MSAPRISLLVPTRGRPDNVRRLIESATTTAAGPIEFVFRTDSDDALLPAELVDLAEVITVTGPRGLLSQMWNECAAEATADVMMHAGDDLVFRTEGWDDLVLDEFTNWPDGLVLVHGDDQIHGGRLATHGFLTRRWVRTLGYFCPPYFSSDYNDVWLTEVADAVGRRVYLPYVVTEHMHPVVGKAEWDLTHRERLARHQADDVASLYRSLRPRRDEDVHKLLTAMGRSS